MATDHHRVYDAKLSAQVLLRPISHPTLDSDFDNVQQTINPATSLIPEPFLNVQTAVLLTIAPQLKFCIWQTPKTAL
jgi:hypothetical protein